MRDSFTRHAAIVAAACAALALAGCGSEDPAPKAKAKASASASPSVSPSASPSDPAASADTALGQGGWLLAVSTAGGADAEKATTTYLTYDPSTGKATARRMPGVSTPNADVPDAALLVSGDRRWAVPDTGVSRSETSSGRLTVYSTTSRATKVLDLRRLTGESTLKPLGWAFDPRQPELLRVVDSRNRVWSLAVSGGRAAPAGTLAKGPWVFADGFNRNTGLPYVESITSEATKPAGNGKADTTPVSRAGGTVLGSGSTGLAALPSSPCRLGAAFTTADGTTWEFCADSATVRAYVLAKGATTWSPYGKPSSAVAPEAAGFGFALPPTG
jgi:hypothetical protein